MASLIASAPHIRLIDQPLDLNDYDAERKLIKQQLLPDKYLSQFIGVTQEEQKQVIRYFNMLLSCQNKVLCEPYLLPKHRTLIKECDSLPMMDWFAKQFKPIIIYLVRHPIPQALSVMRAGWQNTAPAYLEDDFFANQYLSGEQIRLAHKVLGNGTDLEKGVLNWVFENLYPLKYAAQIDLALTYEELVIKAEQVIDLLVNKLSIVSNKRMYAKINTPSSSREFSNTQSNEAILQNKREYLVEKWLSQVTAADLVNVQEILDIFEISTYQAASPCPAERVLHFPTNGEKKG